MNKDELLATVAEIFSKGRGILATDASAKTISKRMEAVGISPSDENRRAFREILLSAPGLSEFIGGVILNDEIIRQKTSGGLAFADFVKKQGMVPGIKVDKGAKDLANYPGEKVTEGLDELRERLAEYKSMGARFAKWRAVVAIGEGLPTRVCIEANAHALARYAALCQEAAVVPILEPELLMDGGHDLERAEQVTSSFLISVFAQAAEQRIVLEGVILKPSLVVPGEEFKLEISPQEVAEATIRTLLKSVPKEVAAVVFLSGGQEAKLVTERLNEIGKKASELPWQVSFSFERALEGPAMEIWKAEGQNAKAAQEALLTRARLNCLAIKGQYNKEEDK